MVDLNSLPLPQLFEKLVTPATVSRLRESMEAEDGLTGAGDVTTMSIIPADALGGANIVARQAGVAAGLAVARLLCRTPGPAIELMFDAADGDHVAAGKRLGRISGQMRMILQRERPLLNVIGWLSGIATYTAQYVEAIKGTRAAIFDTRKTTPGLRRFEKYAVRCGGGMLHRLGLDDAALYKDNHLAFGRPEQLAHDLAEAIWTVRKARELRFVEVEVESLDQLHQVLSIEPGMVDIVLLDNMDVEHLKQAADLRDRQAPRMLLEASGGVGLANVRQIAETGVDRISVGSITHSAPWLDVALDVTPP